MSFARALQRNRPLTYIFAVVLGVSSGIYMFDAPLRKYAEEQARLAAEQQQQQHAAAGTDAAAAAAAKQA